LRKKSESDSPHKTTENFPQRKPPHSQRNFIVKENEESFGNLDSFKFSFQNGIVKNKLFI
jgi:hypothetical protein